MYGNQQHGGQTEEEPLLLPVMHFGGYTPPVQNLASTQPVPTSNLVATQAAPFASKVDARAEAERTKALANDIGNYVQALVENGCVEEGQRMGEHLRTLKLTAEMWELAANKPTPESQLTNNAHEESPLLPPVMNFGDQSRQHADAGRHAGYAPTHARSTANADVSRDGADTPLLPPVWTF